MPGGLYPLAAGDDAWAAFIDQAITALNDGFVLDQGGTNSTGAFTTNATYASGTTFTVPGDQTAVYTPGRRLRIVHAGGTTYCEVVTAVFGASTTVTIGNVTSGPTTMTSAISTVAFGHGSYGLAGNLVVMDYFAATDGATITFDVSKSDKQKVTLAGNRTVAAPTNAKSGQVLLLRIAQDATPPRTLTWNAVFKWPGGTAPALSSTANAVDLFGFLLNGSNFENVLQAFDVR